MKKRGKDNSNNINLTKNKFKKFLLTLLLSIIVIIILFMIGFQSYNILTGNVIYDRPFTLEQLSEGIDLDKGRNTITWTNEITESVTVDKAFESILDTAYFIIYIDENNKYTFWFNSNDIYATYNSLTFYKTRLFNEVKPNGKYILILKNNDVLVYEQKKIIIDSEWKYWDGEVIIKFKENVDVTDVSKTDGRFARAVEKSVLETNKDSINKIFNKYGIKSYDFTSKNNYRNSITGNVISGDNGVFLLRGVGNTIEAINELKQDSNVEFADLNHVVSLFYIPNDPQFRYQWSHRNTNAEKGWEIERGTGVVIAIIDSGVDYNHEDLKGNMLADCLGGCPAGKGYDVVNLVQWDYDVIRSRGYVTVPNEDYEGEDNNPMDISGHGTHVAGIASAVTNNNLGIAGVCHNCKIMPIKVIYILRKRNIIDGKTSEYFVSKAIDYAIDNNAKIISMSLGFQCSQTNSCPSTNLINVLDRAYENNVIVIASAGNEGDNTPIFPAAYDKVIAVASTNQNNRLSSFSNYGSWVDVAAPGGDSTGEGILSTLLGNSYGSSVGTSQAAPYVSGLVGLLISRDSSLTPDEVNIILKEGLNEHGIVDVEKTLKVKKPSLIINKNRNSLSGGLKVELYKKIDSRNWNKERDIYIRRISIPARGFLWLERGINNNNELIFPGLNNFFIDSLSRGEYKFKVTFDALGSEFDKESNFEFIVKNNLLANPLMANDDNWDDTPEQVNINGPDGTSGWAHDSSETRIPGCYNGARSDYIRIYPTKTYKFSIWIKSTDSRMRNTFGFNLYDSQRRIISGKWQNPYFKDSNGDQDWKKWEGYIGPSNQANCEKEEETNGKDWCNSPSSEWIKINFNGCEGGNDGNGHTYFMYPRVEEVSGIYDNIVQCIDTDGGQNPNEFGSAIYGDSRMVDSCAGARVREAYCNNNIRDTTLMSCSQNSMCNNGVCTQVTQCTDSDNGRDYTFGGTVTYVSSGISTPYPDRCLSTTQLREYYCSGTSYSSEIYTCPRGQVCQSDRCVSVQEICTNGIDDDGDTRFDCDDSDCNSNSACIATPDSTNLLVNPFMIRDTNWLDAPEQVYLQGQGPNGVSGWAHTSKETSHRPYPYDYVCYDWAKSELIPILPSKNYKASIWIKSNDVNLENYFGFFLFDANRNRIYSSWDNPYFKNTKNDFNSWVKWEGYLGASNSGIATNCDTTNTNGDDWCNSQNAAYIQIRFVSCNADGNANGITYFMNPRIEEIREISEICTNGIDDDGDTRFDCDDSDCNSNSACIATPDSTNLLVNPFMIRDTNWLDAPEQVYLQGQGPNGVSGWAHTSKETSHQGPNNAVAICYDKAISDLVEIDKNKKYKLSVWIKTNDVNLNNLFGFQLYDNNRVRIPPTWDDTHPWNNPYFRTSENDPLNSWIKLEGILGPYNSVASNCQTTSTNGNDWCNNINAKYVQTRFFSCHGDGNANGITYFMNPKIEVIS